MNERRAYYKSRAETTVVLSVEEHEHMSQAISEGKISGSLERLVSLRSKTW